MSLSSFCHGWDRLFNHKRWVHDEKLKTQQKAVKDAHEENLTGIDANKKINIEAAKNGVYLQNGWRQQQTGSKSQDMLYYDA
ncbi:MAG TPA: hypothetical protein VF427_07540 [Noviherbaspirillum sp.]